jgi:hypothetical protein
MGERVREMKEQAVNGVRSSSVPFFFALIKGPWLQRLCQAEVPRDDALLMTDPFYSALSKTPTYTRQNGNCLSPDSLCRESMRRNAQKSRLMWHHQIRWTMQHSVRDLAGERSWNESKLETSGTSGISSQNPDLALYPPKQYCDVETKIEFV